MVGGRVRPARSYPLFVGGVAMSDEESRRLTDHVLLRELARQALGVRVARVERLRGGTKKGVYRLVTATGFAVIAYVWSERENFWPVFGQGRREDPFAHADGVELFVAARDRLARAGVRVPAVHVVKRDHPGLGTDVALVEEVPGPTLEEYLAWGDTARVERVLGRLRTSLEAMAARTGPGFGKVSRPLDGERECVPWVVERARADLAEGARRRAELGRVRRRVAALLEESAARVEPRRRYGLVHGELGPDHVLVDTDGEPVLIDVEGLMFFDVEWEHAFLRLRFGEWYRYLKVPGLDAARLDLYVLAQRLSLVAGPLRLLEGDFPDRRVMMDIVEHNLAWVLDRVG